MVPIISIKDLVSLEKGITFRLTADKREIKDFPKLPSATSFIRKTLYAIAKPKVFKLQHLKYKEGLKWER